MARPVSDRNNSKDKRGAMESGGQQPAGGATAAASAAAGGGAVGGDQVGGGGNAPNPIVLNPGDLVSPPPKPSELTKETPPEKNSEEDAEEEDEEVDKQAVWLSGKVDFDPNGRTRHDDELSKKHKSFIQQLVYQIARASSKLEKGDE